MKTDTWDERLADQVRRNFKNYYTQRIELDNAAENQEIIAVGDLIYIKAVSSSNAAATIKLNRNTNEVIELNLYKKIKTVFTKFFITNSALAGEWIDLLIGINFDIEDIIEDLPDSHSIQVITNALANTNTVGAAQSCQAVLCKASTKNTGAVWVNFDTAAVQGACMPLEPGESISEHLTNINRINANFEVAAEKLFVLSEG